MRVRQLIEALQALDPDAVVLPTLNGHCNPRLGSICRVAGGVYQGVSVVAIGNWSADKLDWFHPQTVGPHLSGKVYVVRSEVTDPKLVVETVEDYLAAAAAREEPPPLAEAPPAFRSQSIPFDVDSVTGKRR